MHEVFEPLTNPVLNWFHEKEMEFFYQTQKNVMNLLSKRVVVCGYFA